MAIMVPMQLTALANSHSDEAPDHRPRQVQKSVELLDNGAVITLTSENSEKVSKMQERAANRTPKHDDVSVSVSNLDNGVQITITSTDEEKVERIQKRAERKRGHKRKGFKKRFRAQFDRTAPDTA